MVKMEMNGLDGTVYAKGHYAEVSAEVMYLVDEFYSETKRMNKERAEAFRIMVMEWAKGNLDD